MSDHVPVDMKLARQSIDSATRDSRASTCLLHASLASDQLYWLTIDLIKVPPPFQLLLGRIGSCKIVTSHTHIVWEVSMYIHIKLTNNTIKIQLHPIPLYYIMLYSNTSNTIILTCHFLKEYIFNFVKLKFNCHLPLFFNSLFDMFFIPCMQSCWLPPHQHFTAT